MDAATGGTVVNSNQSSVTVRLAALRIQKSTPTLGYVTAGTTITYNYTLTNTGNVTLYPPFNVSDDHITPGTPFICLAPGPVSLPVGGNITCTSKTYSTIAADLTAGSVTNIASATALDAGSNTVTSNTSSVTVYRVVAPVISKSFSPNPIAVGTTSTLTFTITNPASNVIPLTGVGFVDNLPAGLTVAITPEPAQCGGSVTNTTTRITLTGGTVLANSSCTVTALVTAVTRGSYNNTSLAVTSTNGGTGNTANAILNVVSPPVITKAFSPNMISVGEDSSITFTLTNPNPTTVITGVGFTDMLPAGLQVAVAPNANATGCSASSTPVYSPVAGDTGLIFGNASIAGGGTCIVTVTVTGLTSGTKNNTTSAITSTEGGTGSTSNTATLLVNNPLLAMAKSITSGNPYIATGGAIHYNYRLTNTGNVTLIGNGIGGIFTVTDDMTSVTCPATPAGLDPGNYIDCTSTYTVTLADMNSGSVTNVATAHGLYGSTLVDSNQDTQTATATQSPELTLDKTITAFAHYGEVGNNIAYNYLLTNSGNVTIHGTGLSGEFTATDDKTSVTCPLTTTTLDPGLTVTCTGSYLVTQTDLDFGSVQNIATAYAEFGVTPVSSNTDTATAISDQDPELTLVKSIVSGNPYIRIGDEVAYSYLLSNTGNVTLTGAGAGGVFTVTDDRTTVTCDPAITTLAPIITVPTDTVTCTSTYIIVDADITAQSVTNTASGHGMFGVSAVNSAEDTARVDIAPGSIIGTVYNDRNVNRLLEPEETGIVGVTIDIYDSTGTTLVITIVTAANGSYSSGDLLPGTYIVREHDPVGYVSTTPNELTVLVAPDETSTADFGEYRASSAANNTIRGTVYNDANLNSILDTGEIPLAGVTVTLQDVNNLVVATTTTAANGTYSFLLLPAGVFTVVETNPGGFTSTTLDHVSVTLSGGTLAVVDFGDQTGTITPIDPAVTKFGSPERARVGNTVVYTITVGNNGTADALNVILTDAMPLFLDIVNISVNPAQNFAVLITGNTFSIDFGTVTPADFYTVTIVTRVKQPGKTAGWR